MEVDDVLSLAVDEVGELRSPVMLVALAGLFDIGTAATSALDRLADPDRTVTVGEIDPDPFYDFTQARPLVMIEDGERRICWPDNRIDVVRGEHRDLVIATGTEPHLFWRTYADCLITATALLGCEAVVTVGSFADVVPHTRAPRVSSSTTDPRLAKRLGIGGPTYQGPTGVAGVLQVALAESSVPAVAVRVGIPHYVMNTDQPASAHALVEHLHAVLGLGPVVMSEEERAEISHTRDLHDELVATDDQLIGYVAQLEHQYDLDIELSMPSADELGAQFEAFLDEVAPPDATGADDTATDETGTDETGTDETGTDQTGTGETDPGDG